MLLVWGLGTSSLVLVLCLFFPVIIFLICRQLRLAAARREEIRRLLILAQEEASRAELEASTGYAGYEYDTVPFSDVHHCVVCYFPTKTRCARCKAAHYCSTKCQIVHWRQGHKDECHPSTITFTKNNEESNSGLKVVEKDQGHARGDKLEAEQHAIPAAKPTDESVSSESTSSLANSRGNIADVKEELLPDKEEASSIAETSGSSFSGFSSSPSNDSSDDVSVCESISSFDSDRLEAPLDTDIALETSETRFGTNNVAPPLPLSPKFTRLLESVDSFANLKNIDHSEPGVCVGESLCRSNSLRCNAVDGPNRSVVHSTMPSSGFWGRSVDCIEAVSDAHNESAPPESSEASKREVSDSGSSVCLPFSCSEETSSKHAKICDMKNALSDEAAVEYYKPTGTVTLPKTSSQSSANTVNYCSRASCSKDDKPASSSASSSIDLSSGLKGVSTCTSAVDVTNSSSLGSRKSDDVTKDPCSASYPWKTGEVKHLSSKALDDHIAFGGLEHSATSAKARKALDTETRNDVTLRAASLVNGRNGF